MNSIDLVNADIVGFDLCVYVIDVVIASIVGFDHCVNIIEFVNADIVGFDLCVNIIDLEIASIVGFDLCVNIPNCYFKSILLIYSIHSLKYLRSPTLGCKVIIHPQLSFRCFCINFQYNYRIYRSV